MTRFDTVYGFGNTEPAVLDAILALRERNPAVNDYLAGLRRDWTRSADALSSLPCAERAVTFFSAGCANTEPCVGAPIPEPVS